MKTHKTKYTKIIVKNLSTEQTLIRLIIYFKTIFYLIIIRNNYIFFSDFKNVNSSPIHLQQFK